MRESLSPATELSTRGKNLREEKLNAVTIVRCKKQHNKDKNIRVGTSSSTHTHKTMAVIPKKVNWSSRDNTIDFI